MWTTNNNDIPKAQHTYNSSAPHSCSDERPPADVTRHTNEYSFSLARCAIDGPRESTGSDSSLDWSTSLRRMRTDPPFVRTSDPRGDARL